MAAPPKGASAVQDVRIVDEYVHQYTHKLLPKGSVIKGKKYRYTVDSVVSHGVFGDVYNVRNSASGMSHMRVELQKLPNEYDTFSALSTLIEEVLSETGTCIKKHFVVYEDHCSDSFHRYIFTLPVGATLNDIRRYHLGCNFPPSDSLNFAVQAFMTIQHLHFLGYVHGELSISSFSLGIGPYENTVYLTNFGRLRKHMNKVNGIVVPQRKRVPFSGANLVYAPRCAHRREDFGRKDDLESWLFISADLFDDANPPWKPKRPTNILGERSLLDIKELLFKGSRNVQSAFFYYYPFEFYPLLAHIRRMQYDSVPDYGLFQKSFIILKRAMGVEEVKSWVGHSKDMTKYPKPKRPANIRKTTDDTPTTHLNVNEIVDSLKLIGNQCNNTAMAVKIFQREEPVSTEEETAQSMEDGAPAAPPRKVNGVRKKRGRKVVGVSPGIPRAMEFPLKVVDAGSRTLSNNSRDEAIVTLTKENNTKEKGKTPKYSAEVSVEPLQKPTKKSVEASTEKTSDATKDNEKNSKLKTGGEREKSKKKKKQPIKDSIEIYGEKKSGETVLISLQQAPDLVTIISYSPRGKSKMKEVSKEEEQKKQKKSARKSVTCSPAKKMEGRKSNEKTKTAEEVTEDAKKTEGDDKKNKKRKTKKEKSEASENTATDDKTEENKSSKNKKKSVVKGEGKKKTEKTGKTEKTEENTKTLETKSKEKTETEEAPVDKKKKTKVVSKEIASKKKEPESLMSALSAMSAVTDSAPILSVLSSEVQTVTEEEKVVLPGKKK